MSTSTRGAVTVRRTFGSPELLAFGVVLTVVGLLLLGLAAYLQITFSLPDEGLGASSTTSPDAARALIAGVVATIGGLYALTTAVVRLARTIESRPASGR